MKCTAASFVSVAASTLLATTFSGFVAANSFTVAPNTSGGFGNYRWDIGIDGETAVGNPPLYLARGAVYTFGIANSSIHPFWIKTSPSTGSLNAYAGSGLSANGVTAPATITFNVPQDAPEILYYDCGNHFEMHGPINLVIFKDGFGN